MILSLAALLASLASVLVAWNHDNRDYDREQIAALRAEYGGMRELLPAAGEQGPAREILLSQLNLAVSVLEDLDYEVPGADLLVLGQVARSVGRLVTADRLFEIGTESVGDGYVLSQIHRELAVSKTADLDAVRRSYQGAIDAMESDENIPDSAVQRASALSHFLWAGREMELGTCPDVRWHVREAMRLERQTTLPHMSSQIREWTEDLADCLRTGGA